MATLEKPKTKHQKKSKLKPLILPDIPIDTPEDEDAESGEPAVDIDFPSTSTSEEAPAIVAVQEGEEPDEVCEDAVEDEEPNPTDSENILQSEREPSVEPVAPSAPVFEGEETSKVELTLEPGMIEQIGVPAPLYPDLQEMKVKELFVSEKQRYPQVQSMVPLSGEQLAQFYRVDGEMALAEAFEKEFLTRELQENDQCMNHPLYQLLQRYAKARAEFSLNVLEFEALRRKCKALANELWTVREQTFAGTGTCGDGKVVHASHISRNVLSAHRNQLKLLKSTRASALLVPSKQSRKRSSREMTDENSVCMGFEVEPKDQSFSMFMDNLERSSGANKPERLKRSRSPIITRSRSRTCEM